MFGSKLKAADLQVTALLGVLASIGYKPASAEEATEAGLKAHLSANQQQAVNAAVAPLTATVGAYAEGLIAAGVVIPVVQGEAISAAGVQAAVASVIAARATTQAVETVASAGHAAALAVPKGSEAADPTAMSADELGAAVQAEKDPVKRKALFSAYERRFLDAKR